MARLYGIAFVAGACLATAGVAGQPEAPATPPPSSARAPATSETTAAAPEEKAPAKAAPAEKTPYVGAWRKAYIAKHGHEPGAAPKTDGAKTPASPDVAAKPDAKPDTSEDKAPAKADPDKKAEVSAWRKAYIAKHGHEPGAAPKAAPAKPKDAGKALPKWKRCP